MKFRANRVKACFCNSMQPKLQNLKGVQIMKKLLLFTLALVCGMSAWGVNLVEVTDATSLSSALTNAKDGDSIVVKQNITLSPSSFTNYCATGYLITNSSAINVVVNLGEYTITANAPSNDDSGYLLSVEGSAKVKFTGVKGKATIIGKVKNYNSSAAKNGYGYWGLIGPGGNSNVTIENITFYNQRQNSGVDVYGYATCTIKNCDFKSGTLQPSTESSSADYRAGGVYVEENGSATIEDCTCDLKYTGGNNPTQSAMFKVASENSKLSVDKGSYTSVTATFIVMSHGGKINISSGTFKCTGSSGVIYMDYDAYSYGYQQKGEVNIDGGIFIGRLFVRSGASDYNKLSITKGIFTTNSIVNGSSDLGMSKADDMYFKGYKAYTGSLISDVKPYADYAAAIDDGQTTFNLCATNTISANTTLSGVSITQKGNADAFTVTGALTVDGTTTITNYTDKNAINVNGGSLTVPSTGTGVTIGTLAKTSGTISLSAGTYSQDVKDYVAEGYESVKLSDTSWKVQAEPTEYNRSVTSGNWGTVMVGKNAEFTGATLYKIINKASDESYIELEEVSGILPANTPFIFQASSNQLVATYTKSDAITVNANGLIGTLTEMNWTAKAANYTGLTGYYMISGGKLVKAADGSALDANRAYVDMSAIEDLTETPAQGRRIFFGKNGVDETTGCDAISAESAQAQKVMLNGKMFIRRGNQLFDAQGALVK